METDNRTRRMLFRYISDYPGTTYTILKDFFELKGGHNVLDAYTWNTSTKYSHEVIVQFGVLPKWVLIPQLLVKKVYAGLEGLIGKWKEI